METALAWIGKLYAVEKDLRERCQGEWQQLTLDERAAQIAAERQERSRPLLDDFHAWLEAEAPKVLPKSDVRGAMDYTLSNWAASAVYSERRLVGHRQKDRFILHLLRSVTIQLPVRRRAGRRLGCWDRISWPGKSYSQRFLL